MEKAMRIEACTESGVFAPARIAKELRTTQEEVARTIGLGRDALMRADRVQSPKTQKRLREMVEILNRVEPRFGSVLIAYAWYRAEPLAGFGGLTPMQLVRDGHTAEVMDYIDADDAARLRGRCRRDHHCGARSLPACRAGEGSLQQMNAKRQTASIECTKRGFACGYADHTQPA